MDHLLDKWTKCRFSGVCDSSQKLARYSSSIKWPKCPFSGTKSQKPEGLLVQPYGPSVGCIGLGVGYGPSASFLGSGTAHEIQRGLWFNHLAKVSVLLGQLTEAGESMVQPYGPTVGWIGF